MAEREVHRSAHNDFSHFEFESPPLSTTRSAPVATPSAGFLFESAEQAGFLFKPVETEDILFEPFEPDGFLFEPVEPEGFLLESAEPEGFLFEPDQPQNVLTSFNGTPLIEPLTQTRNLQVPIPGQRDSVSIFISETIHPYGNIDVAASPSVSERSVGYPRTAGMTARSMSPLNSLMRQISMESNRPNGQAARRIAHTPPIATTGDSWDVQNPRETRSGQELITRDG